MEKKPTQYGRVVSAVWGYYISYKNKSFYMHRSSRRRKTI
jgi:hypothetical protein